MVDKAPLTIEVLCSEAAAFAEMERSYDESTLYGVTDGKAVGTYLEHKFIDYLQDLAFKNLLPSLETKGSAIAEDPDRAHFLLQVNTVLCNEAKAGQTM